MSRAHLGLTALAFSLTLAHASTALGFCRTTTCDPNDPKAGCKVSAGCVVSGKPLAWSSSCVTVGVHQMGTSTGSLGYDAIASVVESSFSTWQAADCKPGNPSIDVKLLGPIECGLSEYNSSSGNANIVLLRTGPWPYVGAANALGLTTTRFDTQTGELWDADIELNGEADFSTGDPVRGSDLQSVLTHEAGHFLGLSHSTDSSATMRPVYDPIKDGVSFRSLAADDMAGICAIYPPERVPSTTSCENRHGFSSQCGADAPHESKGCGIAPLSRASSLSTVLTLLLVSSTRLARRRRVV
jgi:hypothetical protein